MKKKDNQFSIIILSAALIVMTIIVCVLAFRSGNNTNKASAHFSSKKSAATSQVRSKRISEDSPEMKQWKELSLNKQIALLILATAGTGMNASQQENLTSGEKYAMTGTINDGDIYRGYGESSDKIATIKISGNQVLIDNIADLTTGKTTISEMIAGQDSPLVDELANKIVSLSAMQSAVKLNITELCEGGYETLNGTWKNANGHYITFTDGKFTSNARSFQKGQEYSLAMIQGNEAEGEPLALPVENLDNTCLAMARAGDDVGKNMEKVIELGDKRFDYGDVTDTSKDRIMVCNTSDPASYFTKELGGANAAFYRVN